MKIIIGDDEDFCESKRGCISCLIAGSLLEEAQAPK